ncbi:peptidase S8 [Pueribacillus theae]|uniref:Peptidase S8 n=1 Tax=Pueribacillus theae TaxID=2171751 RepID=A0A2U1K8B4_9BACI|nr:S8 family serine peptidase [Pueribacillus theae]PWA13288.1 peptidase S8 [Pueribacillus theae]
MGKNRKWKAFLIVFVLCISCLHPFAAMAAEAPSQGTALKKEQTVKGTFGELGEVHWYQINPDANEINQDSHMKIKLTGTFEGNVSVYPDLNRAKQDETFDAYRGYITNGEPVEVMMPHAWKGPYYIKVEYFGHSEEDPEQQDATYDITYEGIKLPPTDLGLIGEACPVEVSADKRALGSKILTHLRQIRDNVLAKTEKGKELSSMYYKAAPFLVSKLTFDKKAINKVYEDLAALKDLFGDVAENGENSSHVITKEEQKAIISLYEFAIGHVPDSNRKQIEKIAENMDMNNLAGKKVSAILKENGLVAATESKNRVIVKFKNEKGFQSFQKKSFSQLKQRSLKPLAENGKTAIKNLYIAEVAANTEAVAGILKKLPEVEYAEPVKTYHKNSTDIQYPHQWGLENTGQESGKQHADIRFAKLQPLLKQKQSKQPVKIAVVDTGVDYTLADFEGKIDIEHDYDFVNRDGDAYDDEGHGTHVAGIIAAAADNHYSMTGIHPNATILPVKVLDATGSGESDKIALGIKHAVDKGAKVINLSLGGATSRVIEDVLKYAAEKNVTVVAASGNDGGEFLNYPAASKYTIAVGATYRGDVVWDDSNYGEGLNGKKLDLVAPGVEIPSLLPNGNVTYLSGTSMAAPHVSAVAGLLWSANPSLKPDEIRHIVNSTADDISVEEPEYPDFPDDDFSVGELEAGYDPASGWGRLNAWGALSMLDLGLSVRPLTDNDEKITGKAAKGTQLELKNGETLLVKGKADDKGTFSFKIPPQKAKEVLRLTAKKGAAETSVRVVVQDTPPPATPTVNRVTDRDTAVTGKAPAGTTITVKANKKTLGTAKPNDKGQFKVNIPKQKAGTVLHVMATSVSKKTSKPALVTVIDITPPEKPKVHKVSDRDTFVTGSTEAGATVYVKHKEKTIGEKKADRKGTFKIKIKKQKAGTVLYVTAKDPAGNTSKATKITVKKYKK